MGKSRALIRAFSVIRAAIALASLTCAVNANAGNRVQINAVMDGTCSAFAVPLNFGTLPAKTFSIAQSTVLQVDCPASTTITIALDNGQNFGGGSRRMVRQGGQAKWLPYELYKDVARLNRWGSTGTQVVTTTTPSNGSKLNLTIYGFTSGNVGSGAYMDQVTVTITF